MTGPAGCLRGKVHVLPVRVYWEDTDAGGLVYHSNYLNYAERGRTEMVRAIGVSQSRLMAERGIAFAVRHCAADFLRPARLDDELEVETRLTGVGGASMDIAQRVRRGAEDLVRLSLRLACMHAGQGRPARLPAGLRERFQQHVIENKG